MDDLNIHVLQGFGIRAKRIMKEKSAYILSTDKGYKMIRKSFDTCDSISFQHEIKEFLAKKGFLFTDRFDMSVNCKPYIEYDNNIYTMTSVFDFKEADFFDKTLFIKIIEQIATFHKVAQKINFSSKVHYGDSQIIETYKKNLEELNIIKKKISSQKRFSDFDVLYIKNYNYYKEQIETTIELLEKTKVKRYLQMARLNNTICHGLLKEENILTDNPNVYIINFSNASIGYSLFDLCNIIKRYVKNLPQNYLTISEIIDIYSKINPLEQEELSILYPLLLFPHKFIRICGQYYSKKRTWTPSAIANRMETVVNSKEAYHEYVKQLNKH